MTIALCCLLAACGKNEFTISGKIKNGGSRTLSVVYTALSNSHDELIKSHAFCTDGTFTFKGVTRYPTIVWIMSSDGRTLCMLYAEKGDDLTIEGEWGTPQEWKIGGNKVSEELSDWINANKSILSGPEQKELNGAVAKFVEAHPKDLASALILLTYYFRKNDEAGFTKLWDSLKISDKERAGLLHVAMTTVESAESRSASVTVPQLTLHAPGDSTVTIDPKSSRASILYFWRRTDGVHRSALRKLASQPSDVQIADIYLDPDTVQWRYNIQNDTIKPRNARWAFGGEMNLSLSRLAIPSDPYFIVTDRKGRQLYRGTSPDDASKAAEEAK